MPREVSAWSGKPLTAPAPVACSAGASSARGASEHAGETPALRSAQTTAAKCPQCSRGELRVLASGGLGCSTCGAVFRAQEATPQREPAPEPEEALDQIDAINAMLRRNTLVLAPGGVPLAQNEEQTRSGRRRHANSRRIR